MKRAIFVLLSALAVLAYGKPFHSEDKTSLKKASTDLKDVDLQSLADLDEEGDEEERVKRQAVKIATTVWECVRPFTTKGSCAQKVGDAIISCAQKPEVQPHIDDVANTLFDKLKDGCTWTLSKIKDLLSKRNGANQTKSAVPVMILFTIGGMVIANKYVN